MTIFQRIINRDIPATIEFEDDDVIVIRDIAPNAPVHLLVITKEPIPSINALTPDHQQLVGKVFLVAAEMARKFGVTEGGYRVVTNVNADAGQTVFHLHFHVLGGEQLGAMNGNQKPETGNQKPETGQRPAANGQRPTANGKRPSALVLEGGLFLVAAIGLAIGFNQMNTRRIPWVKPAIERVAATDDMLGLAGGGADSVVGNQQTAQTSTDQTAENANTSQPDGGKKVPQPKSDSGVVLRGSAVPSEKPDKPAFTSQPGVVLEINRSQFERLLKVPNFLIDARTPESYAKGHIGNAVNVYGGEVESRIPELLGMVPKDRAVLIYCDGGECELSHHVANALKGFGYGPIYIYTGGWAEWNK